jgi:hypothetical protein
MGQEVLEHAGMRDGDDAFARLERQLLNDAFGDA